MEAFVTAEDIIATYNTYKLGLHMWLAGKRGKAVTVLGIISLTLELLLFHSPKFVKTPKTEILYIHKLYLHSNCQAITLRIFFIYKNTLHISKITLE